MKWNLRMVAAQRDIWRPTELLAAFKQVGFEPSLSKVAQLWGKQPISLRLDELDKICAALECTVGDLLQAEPLTSSDSGEYSGLKAVGDDQPASGRPAPRTGRAGGSSGRLSLPPN